MISDKCVSVCHTLPPLPPEFKKMAEMPADLTTGEEQESSSKERDESSVCDNDSDFNDAVSSDKEV